ncbi:MAG: TIGR03016 family PEP-CTERM system-associated outer membrane protein, partial [Nitrosomonas sp.]|nr:TIGR03016 family PEP-CTERM system-associated outer membrane protein [Nitrosomonas sp.]
MEWEFNPRLTVSETYTDNVRLGAAGLGGGGGFGFGGARNQGGDFITQINPGISFTGVGRRLNMQTNYTMNNLIFANNSNFNRIRHQLNANATAELLKDFFFIDGAATRSQQNTTAFGPQAVDNTNVTGNRLDLSTYNVSPYLRYRFKTFASTELRYTRGIVESSGGGNFALRNSQRDSYQFNLNSGSAFRTLQWGLNYNKNIINFTSFNREIKMERSLANLRYNLSPKFAFTATGGYESN